MASSGAEAVKDVAEVGIIVAAAAAADESG